MSRYRLTPEARADILDIWKHIAADNANAADRVEEAIFEACRFVANSPMAGQVRADITSRPVRFWTVRGYPAYQLVYTSKPVKVLRVPHAARNLSMILR